MTGGDESGEAVPPAPATDHGLSVAIVGAETPGNVGTIARSMKNFGVTDLYLVDPPPLEPGSEAHGFAGRAREDVLPGARTVSFDWLVEQFHTVGTTAITNQDDRHHVRYPFKTPAELATSLADVDRETCVVFGRERVGLHNEELARLDEVCSIPANPEYPVLNLGQAATIVLYELRTVSLAERGDQQPDRIVRAEEGAIEGLHEQFADLIAAAGLPVEKRPKTGRLFRRLLGRAHPTRREVSVLRGVFRRATRRARRGAPPDDDAAGREDDSRESDDETDTR